MTDSTQSTRDKNPQIDDVGRKTTGSREDSFGFVNDRLDHQTNERPEDREMQPAEAPKVPEAGYSRDMDSESEVGWTEEDGRNRTSFSNGNRVEGSRFETSTGSIRIPGHGKIMIFTDLIKIVRKISQPTKASSTVLKIA